MCRWIFYYGEEVCIAKLIFGARHGLATMSEVRVHLAVRQSKPRSLERMRLLFSLRLTSRARSLRPFPCRLTDLPDPPTYRVPAIRPVARSITAVITP